MFQTKIIRWEHFFSPLGLDASLWSHIAIVVPDPGCH